jgi:DNA (cytosine-5)-methyltransferase 1
MREEYGQALIRRTGGWKPRRARQRSVVNRADTVNWWLQARGRPHVEGYSRGQRKLQQSRLTLCWMYRGPSPGSPRVPCSRTRPHFAGQTQYAWTEQEKAIALDTKSTMRELSHRWAAPFPPSPRFGGDRPTSRTEGIRLVMISLRCGLSPRVRNNIAGNSTHNARVLSPTIVIIPSVGVESPIKDSSGSFAGMLDDVLRPTNDWKWTAIDLFAGCGGLALGFESIGFRTIGYEMNQDGVETYQRNLGGDCTEAFLTPDFDFPAVDVVIGGPPCQPFSVGGLQQGLKDSRDGFPTFISAVSRLQPRLFLFENVRGMLYRNKKYLDEILETLRNLGYDIEVKLMNAVNFGVPQNRERLIVVGHRERFEFPEPLPQRVTAGEALGSLAFEYNDESKWLTPSMDKYVKRYEDKSACVNPRDLHLDRPARTLTCRNLAGATGDMHRIRLTDGRRRRLTTREAARLQTFPDWFEFAGNETSIYNQIGNAVPPLFGAAIAAAVGASLEGRVSASQERLF